jgi:hypothetical protein
MSHHSPLLPRPTRFLLSVLLVAALASCAGPAETSTGSPQDTSFLDRLLDTDDARQCDAVGWATIPREFVPTPADGSGATPAAIPTMSAEYGPIHAACQGGSRGIRLLASCFEPLRDSQLTVALDSGMMGMVCSIVVQNETVPGVALDPADFSLVDAAGEAYPTNQVTMSAARAAGLPVQHQQVLVPGTEVRGALGFALPDDRDPPYLLEWTPRVNDTPQEPLWIVLDRFIAVPAPLK